MQENTARVRDDNRTQTEPSVLDRIIDEVREDAQRDASAYLAESIVPEGGE